MRKDQKDMREQVMPVPGRMGFQAPARAKGMQVQRP